MAPQLCEREEPGTMFATPDKNHWCSTIEMNVTLPSVQTLRIIVMCVLRPAIVSVIGASDLILHNQSPYVASFTRPVRGEPDTPRNGIVV